MDDNDNAVMLAAVLDDVRAQRRALLMRPGALDGLRALLPTLPPDAARVLVEQMLEDDLAALAAQAGTQ